MLIPVLFILNLLANIGLGLLVFSRAPKRAPNRIFGLIAISIAAWALTSYLSQVVTGAVLSVWLVKGAFVAAGFIGLSFALFSINFPDTNKRLNPKVRAYEIFMVIVCLGHALLTVLTNRVISGVHIGAISNDVIPGALYGTFGLVFFIFTGTALFNLYRKFQQASRGGRERLQFKYIFFGFALAVTLGSLTNLILPALFGTNSLARFGSFGVLFLTGFMGYAIVTHRLFDIRMVVARSVAYVLLVGTLAALYGAAIFGVTTAFFPNAAVVSASQNAIYIGLALVLAFTFQPLRRFFEKLTDRIFFRDHYDSQEVLNNVGKLLSQELLLEKLLDHTLQQICLSLHIEVGQFMVFEKDKVFKIAHFGPLPSQLITVPVTHKLRQAMLVADELESGERKQILDEHGIRVSVMLRTRDEFVGFLFLGGKLSGSIYSAQDIRLLEVLAASISIAISNAKAYEEIAQFNLTLQQKVDEATARLRQANVHLQEMDKSKDEFISMAAHQLRTPLTTIKGYLSMIMEGDAGPLTKEQKEFSGYAYDGAQRMVGLVADLLNVARMSSGKFMIERQPTDLAKIVADEVRQLQPHAAAKGLKLLFVEPKTKLPLVPIDADKTRQVIMNFVDNAVYYTKTGGVSVSIEMGKTDIRLKVKDTGIGVPKAAQDQLFTKFYRAENAQQVRPDGTGLGLYLAKRVVEDQGGTIIFETTEGKGSTFGFALPLKPPKEKKDASQPKPSAAEAKPKV